MKKKAIAIFALSMAVLVLSFFGITSAKYKFTVESELYISTEEFYSQIKGDLSDVINVDGENKFFLSDLLLCNYEGENFSKSPITYEVSIFDDNNSADKFTLQYDGVTSSTGVVTVTVDETTAVAETPLDVRIIEKKDISEYDLSETVTIKVRAIRPYVKDLYSKEITLNTVYTLGIGMDYNKYSIVNLNDQPFTEADNNFDWMEGVTLTNVPDSLKGVSAADVVQYDASSVNLSADGIYEVSYDNNNTNPHIVLQPNVRTVEVGIDPVPTTYSYDSEVPYYTLPYEYKGLNKFELYGAKGGYVGGNGGYTTGTLNSLTYDGELYIYVGQCPGNDYASGYNGGGVGALYKGTYRYYSGGGGATDIRLVNGVWNNQTSLASRIMVAGGGGGACLWGSQAGGGAGGGLTGGKGSSVKAANTTKAGIATGGTQIAGGSDDGKFGIGANQKSGGSGGGGYYGGGTKGVTDGYRQAGAGGSSYISGHAGCIAINSATDITPKVQTYSQIEDSYHYSGLVFRNTSMTAGKNSDHGKAVITTYLVRSNM